ncbi:MAG: hypothetical protein ACKOPN_05780 [Prochlorococcaceae cyanobacterium]
MAGFRPWPLTRWLPPFWMNHPQAIAHGSARPAAPARLGSPLLALLTALAPLAAAAAAPPAEAPPAQTCSRPLPPADSSAWAFTLEPYGFAPWVSSTTTVRGFEVSADLTPGQVLNALEMAGSLRASAERGRVGLLTDLAYTRLGAEKARPLARGWVKASGELSATNGTYDLAVRYRFGDREAATGRPGNWWVIPYAGARLVEARLDVAARLEGQGPLGRRIARSRSLERTWTQPLLGVQGALFVSPTVRLFARGDLGGFDLAGARDWSGNAQAGVGVALGHNTDLNLSWRYLGQAWNNGARRSTGFTSDQSGIELGLRVLF